MKLPSRPSGCQRSAACPPHGEAVRRKRLLLCELKMIHRRIGCESLPSCAATLHAIDLTDPDGPTSRARAPTQERPAGPRRLPPARPRGTTPAAAQALPARRACGGLSLQGRMAWSSFKSEMSASAARPLPSMRIIQHPGADIGVDFRQGDATPVGHDRDRWTAFRQFGKQPVHGLGFGTPGVLGRRGRGGSPPVWQTAKVHGLRFGTPGVLGRRGRVVKPATMWEWFGSIGVLPRGRDTRQQVRRRPAGRQSRCPRRACPAACMIPACVPPSPTAIRHPLLASRLSAWNIASSRR